MIPTELVKATFRRRAMGQYKQDLAREMGISPSYLSKLLYGQRPWTDKLQRAFAAAMNVAVEAIDFASTLTPDVSESDVTGEGEVPDGVDSGDSAGGGRGGSGVVPSGPQEG